MKLEQGIKIKWWLYYFGRYGTLNVRKWERNVKELHHHFKIWKSAGAMSTRIKKLLMNMKFTKFLTFCYHILIKKTWSSLRIRELIKFIKFFRHMMNIIRDCLKMKRKKLILKFKTKYPSFLLLFSWEVTKWIQNAKAQKF